MLEVCQVNTFSSQPIGGVTLAVEGCLIQVQDAPYIPRAILFVVEWPGHLGPMGSNYEAAQPQSSSWGSAEAVTDLILQLNLPLCQLLLPSSLSLPQVLTD